MTDPFATLRSALANRYTIERELGRGGMATVYLARDDRHGRRVAIKVLHPDLSAAVGAERFLREIAIESSLTHPNIVPLYESGEADGSLYYVMPYFGGETLRERLDREKQLPLEDALRIACEVAGALDYAHRRGVVHRDIKPANILLEDGHAVIADFGVARALSSATGEHTLTATGVTLGTPAYMSPEQASAEKEIDGRSDIYALGCVVYEMLAGQPPFTGPNAQAVMARHAMDTVPSMRVVRSAIPEEVEAAVFCALAKAPADRFATAQQFADALTGNAGMGTTLRYTARWAAAARTRKRKRWTLAIAAAVLVPAAAAGGWRAYGGATSSAGDDGGLDRTRVAVLYFTDLSRDRSLEHIADGLTESLIRELQRAGAITVRSQSAVFRYRGTTVSPDSIARALQTGTVIKGEVDAVGDSGVQITVQLLDGASGGTIDRESFRLPMAGLLEASDSLVQDVALLFRARLGREVRLGETLAEAASVDAWSLHQRAERMRKEAGALARADSLDAAMQRMAAADSLLARAEELDPRWIAPRIARAELALDGVRRSRDDRARAVLIETGLAHVQRALELDALDPHALEVRGTLRFRKRHLGLELDPTEAENLLRLAEADLKKATELDRTRASAYNTLSMLLYRRFDKLGANLAAQKAFEADAYLEATPDILWRLYSTSYDLEFFDQASNWCDLGHRRYPDDVAFVACRLWLMTTNLRPPDVAEAWRTLDSMRVRVPHSRWEAMRREYEMLVAVPIAKAGLADSAQRVIERTRGGVDVDPSGELIGHEVLVRTLIGDKERALELLGSYLAASPQHREGFTRGATWWWRSLQNDPRFTALVGS